MIRKDARRGTVPLEVVFTFPILITLVAMCLWLGRAGSDKIAQSSEVRATWQEWEMRAAPQTTARTRTTDEP